MADLNSDNSYSWFGAYLNSKYFNILFTRECAVALPQATVVACSPGTTDTDIDRNLSPTLRFLFRYLGPGLSAQHVGVGAATVALCATAGDIESGAFYAQCKTQHCRESAYLVPPNRRSNCEAHGCGERFSVFPGHRHHCRNCGVSVCTRHFERPWCHSCAALPPDERDIAKRLWRRSEEMVDAALVRGAARPDPGSLLAEKSAADGAKQ